VSTILEAYQVQSLIFRQTKSLIISDEALSLNLENG